MEEILEKIAHNTEPKESFQIVVNDTKTRFVTKFIQQKMKQNGHGNSVTISANTNTLKAVLILENGYQVDFRPDHSVSSVLGFNNAVYSSDYQESENPVNILSINSILVNVDII